MTHFFRAFRHRNYQLFFSGQLISVTGTWMQSVAESWLVYRLTGSAALLGVTAFCSQIPVFVLAPIAGAVADRNNRHRIMVITQSVSMVLPLVLSVLTFTSLVRPWHVFILAGCLGVVNAFDIPARQSFVVEMVGREDLLNAIALNSSMFNGARVIGPAVAGILVAAIGEGWCFLVNGLSYIAVITGLLMMQLPKKSRVRKHSAIRDVLDGFRFVAHTGPVRALLLLLGVVSLTGVPYSVLMPVFAESILHGGARGLGILMAASGLGALGGALSLAGRRDVRGLGRWAGYAAGGFGVALGLFSLSRTFWLSVVLLVPVGYSLMVQMAASNTLIQAMVPDALRGRVMSVYSMMFLGMAPFGGLSAGYAAEHIGAPATVAVGGAVCLVAAIIFRLHLPSVRGEARALIVAQGLAADETPAVITTPAD
ncbi:MAG: MFS transporter [Acidobacteriota bacterium]